jgi:cytochrome c556
MATHFGRVGAMANGKIPFDAKAVADNAEIATMMSKLPYAGFVEGSDKGETKAKPEVWSDSEKFKAAAAKMQDEMVKLNAAAKTGNQDAIKAAFGPPNKYRGKRGEAKCRRRRSSIKARTGSNSPNSIPTAT